MGRQFGSGEATVFGMSMDVADRSAVRQVDWQRLHHAYGRAIDTPGHLEALLGEDAAARRAAVQHLGSAIMHQGTPWTATGPAVEILARWWPDGRLDREPAVRVGILVFLTEVTGVCEQETRSAEELERLATSVDLAPLIDAEDEESLYDGSEASEAFFAGALLGCVRAMPVMLEVMVAGLSHGDPAVRAWAAVGSATLAKLQSMADRRDDV